VVHLHKGYLQRHQEEDHRFEPLSDNSIQENDKFVAHHDLAVAVSICDDRLRPYTAP
jgi:hypothetical protein